MAATGGSLLPMDSQNWPRVRALFESAIDEPRDERESFVRGVADVDPDVRDEVLRLLRSDRDHTEFLSPPPAEVLARTSRSWRPAAGDLVGSFRVEREIGSGGMGTVYAARQSNPSRVVALKLMRSSLSSPRARRRFEVEAEILGSLRHPGIAAIHEAGVHICPDGQDVPFFAMEFVEDARDLLSYARRLDLPGRIRLVQEVCAAVHHAHQKGVIHRDLKPGNILVDTSGRPHVIDYGVARVSNPTDSAAGPRTMTGDVFGTLQYISPEQLTGEDVDTRADVYALGVILYELVAGCPPHAQGDRPIRDLITDVCETVPRPPSAWSPEIQRELDWITLKAVAKAPDERYDSAAALADDLERYLADEPVRAGPPTRRYRVSKFIARNRASVAAASAAVLVLIAGIVTTAWQAKRANAAAARAERLRVEESEQAERARTALRRQTAIFDAVSGLFAEAAPLAADGRRLTVYEVLERRRPTLDSQFQGDPQLRASMEAFFSEIYKVLGLRETSVTLLEKAVTTMAASADVEPVELAWQRVNLADARSSQSRYAEALELLESALPALRGADRPIDQRKFVIALRRSAFILSVLGRAEAADERFAEVLETSQHLLGDEHAETFLTMSQFGRHLGFTQRFREAEVQARRGHEGMVRVESEHSPLALRTASILGQVLDRGHHFAEAVEVRRANCERTLKIYGEDHPNSATELQALAVSLLRVGSIDEAIAASARAVALTESHEWGAQSVVGCRLTLACMLVARRDYAAAFGQLERALQHAEEHLPDGHPATSTLRLRLAWLEVLLERPAAASARVELSLDGGLAAEPAQRRAETGVAHAVLGAAELAQDHAEAAATAHATCAEITAEWTLGQFSRVDPMFHDPLIDALRRTGHVDVADHFDRARSRK